MRFVLFRVLLVAAGLSVLCSLLCCCRAATCLPASSTRKGETWTNTGRRADSGNGHAHHTGHGEKKTTHTEHTEANKINTQNARTKSGIERKGEGDQEREREREREKEWSTRVCHHSVVSSLFDSSSSGVNDNWTDTHEQMQPHA